MIIELKGVEFENKGAELMLRAILERISLYWPDAEIALTPSKKASYLLRASVGAWQKVSLRKLYFDFNSLSYYAPNVIKSYFKKWGIVTEADIDIIIDASGFSYSDQWSPKMSIRHLSGELHRSKRFNKPYIFMPQAFGPFSDLSVRKNIQNSFKHAALICAREADSYRHLNEITSDMDNLFQHGDFTNVVEAIVPDYIDISKKKACIIPNKNMINPRNKNKRWINNYENMILQAIEIYASLGLEPFFLNHEGTEDLTLIERLNDTLDKPLKVVNESDPLKVKGIIISSQAVLCSRYHGCISALSSSIACLSTSWSHKYERLYADYHVPQLLIEPNINKQQLTDLIKITLESNSQLHKDIAINAIKFKAETESLWLKVKTIIDQAIK